jgi:hypothetical protein
MKVATGKETPVAIYQYPSKRGQVSRDDGGKRERTEGDSNLSSRVRRGETSRGETGELGESPAAQPVWGESGEGEPSQSGTGQ